MTRNMMISKARGLQQTTDARGIVTSSALDHRGSIQQMTIGYTRAKISAVRNGALTGAPVETNPILSLAVPTTCPNVPTEVLNSRDTWTDSAAYDAQATKLAKMFGENSTAGGSGRGIRGMRRPVVTCL